MKIYLDETTYEAALQRIRYIYSEFSNVVVTTSGGKDSTVIFNLSLIVAKELDRLPINVLFIDQEAEWRHVIEHIREVMHRPDVKPYWLQCPIRIFNAASQYKKWNYCWAEDKEWMRNKEPDSIHENVYGTDRFKPLFGKFLEVTYPNEPACLLGGVRAEESPARTLSFYAQTYKDITYGKNIGYPAGHYTFYPIYDWSYIDVWKSIHENNWPYCKIYDYMYNRGVPLNNMRVSNLHHETALHSLFILQEIEPDTWMKMADRIPGVNSISQLGIENLGITKLPFMFSSWQEYYLYLVDHLTVDERSRNKFYGFLEKIKYRITTKNEAGVYRGLINILLCNDTEGTKFDNLRIKL